MNESERQRDRWLRSAREDLAYARTAAAARHHAPACFHSQQAAEKAVKAIHFGRGARVVIGHNVRALIQSLDPPVATLSALLDDARDLDVLYIPTRYPNGLESGTPGDAFGAQQSDRALSAAEAIVSAAEKVDA
jgi:HEPN domain-containing protein